MFQIHLWAGLLLGLYTMVMGLTGSALVFRDSLDGLQTPPSLRKAVLPSSASPGLGPTQKPLDDVLKGILSSNNGYSAGGFGDLNRTDVLPVVYLSASAKAGQTAQERVVSFEPNTGASFQTRERYGGVLGWCANLHYYLGLGTRGYTLNGCAAVLFFVVCATGWVLWWPGPKHVWRALWIHWRGRWRRLNWDLHTAGGFWINPLLAVVVLTGVMVIFPTPFEAPLAWVSGVSLREARHREAAPENRERSGAVIPVEQAYRAVLQVLPPDLWVGYLGLPATPEAPYAAFCYRRGSAPYSQPTHIYVDAHRGTVLAVQTPEQLPWGLRAESYVYAVHFGSFGGVVSKVVWLLVGVTPAVLLFTGVVMFWKRQGARWLGRAVRS